MRIGSSRGAALALTLFLVSQIASAANAGGFRTIPKRLPGSNLILDDGILWLDSANGMGGHGLGHGLGLGNLGLGRGWGHGSSADDCSGPGCGLKLGHLFKKHGNWGVGCDDCSAPAAEVIHPVASAQAPAHKAMPSHQAAPSGQGCVGCGSAPPVAACDSCAGSGCGKCGGRGLLGGLRNRLGCGFCGGSGCGNCMGGRLGGLFGHGGKWFVGPGGPVPLTPGQVNYVVPTRSPRDFFAFPPFTQ